ncbi:alpha-L-rhamnosidase C-terminal domain-containing protein [Christensenella tenuis]|uniref:alpha-L-rhamnosidase C-terminal domain-containing protein n=1 Tax=Christensenella tenuis TaxID=2763033 RepID=UPI001FAD6AFF|nr:alpha-L-rhamnosidase C-terminal domain-containing protein [Christensenella tenuis]
MRIQGIVLENHSNIEVLSIYGQISCQWKCEGGRFVLEAAVPFNTSATVVLPSGEVKEVDCGSYRFEEPYMV